MSKVREIDNDGSFKRQQSLFTASFGSDDGQLPVDKGRYRLIWAAPCPWSHRAVIVRQLLGLEDIMSLGMVDPIRPQVGRVDWAFSLDKNKVDPILQVHYLSELYKNADPDYNRRPTVPALIDLKTKKVVHNDYFTLTTALETDWTSFHKQNAPNLYPKHLREEIDALNSLIYSDVNNGVYKCGFAQSQTAYDQAYNLLFARLNQLEQRLEDKRFLFGDYITEADVRLYVTLARFDVAYYSVFKANKKRLVDYPNLWAYARDLYTVPAFRDTTDFQAIKEHYLISARLSHVGSKEETIIPKGPDLSGWDEAPQREYLSESSEVFLSKR